MALMGAHEMRYSSKRGLKKRFKRLSRCKMNEVKTKKQNLLFPGFIIKLFNFVFRYKALLAFDKFRTLKSLMIRWILVFYIPVYIWVIFHVSRFIWFENSAMLSISPIFVKGFLPVPIFKPMNQNNVLDLFLCVCIAFAWALINLVVLNVLVNGIHIDRIEEKWRAACLHVGLVTATNLNPENELKEFPFCVSVNSKSFVVKAMGYVPERIIEKRAELSGDMGLFLGDVGYLKKVDGSTFPDLIEVKYSRQDLPASIPFASVPIARRGSVVFGLGQDGFYSMSLEKIVHLGVSGETGSGKSVFLRQMITQILVTDGQAIVIGIDFKGGVEFSFFSQLGNFVCIDDFEKAGKVLEIVLSEYARRLNIVRNNDSDSVYQLAEKGFYLSPVIVIVDEAAEFFGDKKQGRIYDNIEKIARLGRFAGIHLVVCTQRADVSAIPQQIRSMLVTRAAFKMTQREDSIMFLGTGDAVKLRRLPGRFYIKGQEGNLKELQAPWISKDEAKQILRSVGKKEKNNLIGEIRQTINEGPAIKRAARGEAVSPVIHKVAA